MVVMRDNMEFSAVPASDPFVPLLARTPRAVDRSPMSTPAVFAAPPHPMNASSRLSAVVLLARWAWTARSR